MKGPFVTRASDYCTATTVQTHSQARGSNVAGGTGRTPPYRLPVSQVQTMRRMMNHNTHADGATFLLLLIDSTNPPSWTSRAVALKARPVIGFGHVIRTAVLYPIRPAGDFVWLSSTKWNPLLSPPSLIFLSSSQHRRLSSPRTNLRHTKSWLWT